VLYRIYALPPLSQTNLGHRARGISNNGIIVGESQLNNQQHAFVLLTQPMFGFSQDQTIDLQASITSPIASVARGVNAAGKIAGEARLNLNPGAVTRAFAFELAGGAITATNLGNLFTPDNARDSSAYDITDTSPAWVIGWSELGRPVPPEFLDFIAQCNPGARLVFRRQLIGGAVMEAFFTPGPGNGQLEEPDNLNGEGYGVNAALQIVGQTFQCSNSTGGNCDSRRDAARWVSPTSSVELLSYAPVMDMIAGRGEARGINTAGNIVGFGYSDNPPTPPFTCGNRATFWLSATATPFNLQMGATPSLDESNQTLANAINNANGCVLLSVVGLNVTANSAQLWVQSQTGQWTRVELTSAINSATGWEKLFEATDINDNGWIVGFGDRDLGPAIKERAFLAVPFGPCRADITGNGTVDGDDLGQLLLNFSTPGCFGDIPCMSDLDGDGNVDGADLGILLLTFGPCPSGCGGGAGASGGGGGEGASAFEGEESSEPPTLEELIMMLLELGEDEYISTLLEVWNN
jgi:hypothetical protein